MKHRHLIGILAAALLPLASAQAQITDEDMCRNGLFPDQKEFRLATVAASTPKLYFFNDWDGCPQKGASCQTKAYVLAGDRLLLGKTHGEWTCAWYQGKKHETVGWVRLRDLDVQAQAEPKPEDWAGKWKIYNNPGSIRIVRQAAAWEVKGDAYWGSGASTHFGELEGELKIQGRRAHVGPAMQNEDYECAADMVRIGEFLIVHDNERCGGVNVRFDGVYTRAP